MIKRSLPTTFHLKRGDELLAVLEACRLSGEMFWQICTFVSKGDTAAIEAAIHADNAEELFEMGLRLVDPLDNTDIEYFSLFLEGGQVWVRYADPRDL